MEKLYEGKAKIVYKAQDPDKVVIYFKDEATAFNAQKKDVIEGKGVINNKISSIFFQILEKHGIPTHFVKQLSDREMLAYKTQIIPVEVVVRNLATGSIVKRLGIPEKTPFNPPLIEFYLKNDQLGDPIICYEHILALNLANDQEIKTIKELAFKVNQILKDILIKHDIILVDFKLEFGKKEDGNIVVADEISPDTCRFWDAKTGERMDKDRFRLNLGDLAKFYEEVLRRIENEKD
ncbi:phosphoribosylaminoimidazolesuccinocarboxamide synthase [Sulfurihydrogenibium azorense]|uniref:Phosphoribosylaminoimidazole-succinocarboxamide synthase n=1 Tax=Sulfurihydrogenibium azorense (strain DSM 15241 / OCM 825 / Az-Fu1) TaxID=204536 RepID=C1DVK9_SULAA|nr:phosphoribosylaminoimidazolesuccinocarboxamide synthase [Sulfurihydrogenibium azorense]ACN98360.1 phosphoribosylaminoimidazolesuccinocarboxamide synthase [Sulfurihydrogenibium azorense Az-Fu1]